jgi:copper chaperone CopZ
MKRLSEILEAVGELKHHGRDKAEGEKQFKKKHTDNIQDKEYPAKDTDKVLNARDQKKDTSKITHLSKEEEEAMYEAAEVSTVLESVEGIYESEETSNIILEDGTEVSLDPETAEVVLEVFDSLSEENQDKFLELLEQSKDTFVDLVDFCYNSIEGEDEDNNS